jgi:hypothetical protein
LKALIKECYRSEALDPRLDNDEFDVIGADGVIILPRVWPSMIQPNLSLTIRMWSTTSNILPNVQSRERYDFNQRDEGRNPELERELEEARERHSRLDREWERTRDEMRSRDRNKEQEWERQREEIRERERRREQEWEREREEIRRRDRSRELEWERQREERRRRERDMEEASSSCRLRKPTHRCPTLQNVPGPDQSSKLHSCLLCFAGVRKPACD